MDEEAGPECPADSYLIKSKAELTKGMVEGARGSGGQSWIWKGGRQAWRQSRQASVSQQWEQEERPGSDWRPGNTCPR